MHYLGQSQGHSQSDPYVTVYEHTDFGGRSWRVYPGYYPDLAATADFPNDRISSVYVPPGLVFYGWEHKDKGGRWTGPLRAPASDPGAGHNLPYYQMNDKVSSIEVIDEAAESAAAAAARLQRQAEAAAEAEAAAQQIQQTAASLEQLPGGLETWQQLIAPPAPPPPPPALPATDVQMPPIPSGGRRGWLPWAIGGIIVLTLGAGVVAASR